MEMDMQHDLYFNSNPSGVQRTTSSVCRNYADDPSNTNQPCANRFVYINQNFVSPRSIPCTTNTKVLINPNFRQTIHINPNFKKPAPVKPKIHVNPEILTLTKQGLHKNLVVKTDLPKSEDVSQQNSSSIKLLNPIVRTHTIRADVRPRSSIYSFVKEPATRKRRKSIHTTYKIIRSNKCESPNAEGDPRKLYYSKNKYKIDKTKSRNLKTTGVSASKCVHLSKTATALVRRNVLVRGSKKLNKTRYISINGVLYKKSPNVLKKADLHQSTNITRTLKKGKVLIIRDQIYKMDAKQRTLKLVSPSKINFRRIDVASSAFKQIEPYVYVKTDANKRSQVRNRSVQVSTGKMKKCNVPCPIYRKLGRCRGKENGTCIRVHNPDRIALCTKFLQGACLNSNCLLSHKVSPEKMPTCKYFLEGLCSREDCPYLHVKISPKADICKDFLDGFCKNAKECDRRHQFLCPDFEKRGACSRRRCPYPHGNVVRKLRVQNKVAKRVVKIESNEPKPRAVEQNDVHLRYYSDPNEKVGHRIVTKIADSCEGNDAVSCQVLDTKPSFRKRPKVGELPSFIPLGESSHG